MKLVKKAQRLEGKKNNIVPSKDDQENITMQDSTNASLMNDYFSKVGGELLSKIQPTQDNFDKQHIYWIIPIFAEFSLDFSKVHKDLNSMNRRKAMGPDCVSPRDLKLRGESVVLGLLLVLELRLASSRVPSLWKTSKMHTVFRKGDSLDRSSYRPPQMFSLPSKVLESIACENNDSFIQEIGILNE